MQSTLGLYRPGDSVLHRIGAGPKLLSLLVLGGCSVFLTYWWLVLTLVALLVGAYAVAGMGLGVIVRQVRPMLWLLAFTAAYHVWTASWQRAVVVTFTIVLLVLAAALVTLTTPTSALIDAVVRVVGPLRRFGVDPDRVGLLLTLGIRCVPLVADLATQVREAQLARGTGSSWKAFAVPLIVRALREADAMGEALVARGVDDDVS
ncbi:energy-coupling factor transporter transmembrane component T family protein [Raineyella fluvialis]|uniref:Energy-coupling factor transporter transmembrane protein EcfT n=1 Tax=Raineyella fluvialis TaxID=2662261 RepID=A0A5Q2FCN1_9ACTN|nr:energy-coupling factor transporter transmembrane protein EcfT [Raineyella fluvialis]QGF24549.1 energy-coupling factor transporter transmembrane protein EcfT [Raineyella fluvialis]